jgi:hypothetical protein
MIAPWIEPASLMNLAPEIGSGAAPGQQRRDPADMPADE